MLLNAILSTATTDGNHPWDGDHPWNGHHPRDCDFPRNDMIEHVWLRCMTLHDLILCNYCQQNLSTS